MAEPLACLNMRSQCGHCSSWLRLSMTEGPLVPPPPPPELHTQPQSSLSSKAQADPWTPPEAEHRSIRHDETAGL